jgi:hypothetical protein
MPKGLVQPEEFPFLLQDFLGDPAPFPGVSDLRYIARNHPHQEKYENPHAQKSGNHQQNSLDKILSHI